MKTNHHLWTKISHQAAPLRIRCATALLLLLSVCGFGQSVPTFPLEFFQFPPGFATVYGSASVSYTTNLVSVTTDVAPYYGNVLILDATNLSPAYLEYFVTDTNWNGNIRYDTGTVMWFFEPDWASVTQGGAGPGATAYLIAGGDWSSGSPNGLFRIYVDAGGSNLYFGGVGAGVTTTYVSAPISWGSNTWHSIGVEYSSRNSKIYLDGAHVATGSGVSIVPALGTDTNGFYTNTFFVGSDNTGYEQARGAFWNLDTWTAQYGGWYTNGWLTVSNALETWQATLGGGGFGGMMGMALGGGLLTSGCPCTNCVTGTAVQIVNTSAMPDTNGDGGTTFAFSIEYGTNGVAYDVFSTTNLWTNNMITNGVWTWLGQGTNCGSYSVTNQPPAQQFYVLGGTPATDGSGLTTAYEKLVSHGTTNDTYGTPYLWYLWHGLNPLTSGISTQDPDGDGLLNWQEYLYGTNPQVSEGFAIWVSAPSGTSGIP